MWLDGGEPLLPEIEHFYPDYSLYPDLCKDTTYGFLTRGCPRECDFCIVGKKEGRCSVKVADSSEFWNGQKNIVLLDPNMFACRDWKDLSQQLIILKGKGKKIMDQNTKVVVSAAIIVYCIFRIFQFFHMR